MFELIIAMSNDQDDIVIFFFKMSFEIPNELMLK